MHKHMFYSLLVAVSLSAALLISGSSCKDPEEYNPETPKVPPPEPPQIIFPLADTVICDFGVLFNYTVPAGSQVFQIQADTLSSFSTAEMFLRYGSLYYIPLPFYHGRTTWWARVRAGSANWNNYTAWSDPRRFYLWAER